PPASELKDAEREVRSEFRYSGNTPREAQAFARRLLDVARQSPHKPPKLFVLLRDARDLAAGAGDFDLALETTGVFAQRFQVDIGAMQVELVTSASKNAGAPSGKLVEALARVAEERRTDEDFENGKALSTLSRGLEKKTESAW